MSKKVKGQHGFSLIEIIVVAGIFSIIIMGASSIIVHLAQQVALAEKKIERVELLSLVNRIFQNQDICNAHLAGISVPTDGSNVPIQNAIRAGAQTDSPEILEPNKPLPGSAMGLNIADISLANIVSIDGGTYLSDLVINFDESQKLRPLEIKGLTVAVTAGVISSCETTSGGSANPPSPTVPDRSLGNCDSSINPITDSNYTFTLTMSEYKESHQFLCENLSYPVPTDGVVPGLIDLMSRWNSGSGRAATALINNYRSFAPPGYGYHNNSTFTYLAGLQSVEDCKNNLPLFPLGSEIPIVDFGKAICINGKWVIIPIYVPQSSV